MAVPPQLIGMIAQVGAQSAQNIGNELSTPQSAYERQLNINRDATGRYDLPGIATQEYGPASPDLGTLFSIDPFDQYVGIAKQFRQLNAKRNFENNKRDALRSAMAVNANIGYGDMVMKNLGASTESQVDRYMRGITNFG